MDKFDFHSILQAMQDGEIQNPATRMVDPSTLARRRDYLRGLADKFRPGHGYTQPEIAQEADVAAYMTDTEGAAQRKRLIDLYAGKPGARAMSPHENNNAIRNRVRRMLFGNDIEPYDYSADRF